MKIDHDAEGERIRTLEPGEEAALLQHAGRHLKAIIVACAGMRSTASSTRRPPTCSEMRPEARVRSVQRAWQTCVLKAHGSTPEWEKRPHTGPDSCGNRRPGGQFTPACREALARINLRVHDLGREFACSLLESSADLHDVRDFLGHASITATSRYLASSPIRLARALARLEGEDAADIGSFRTPFAQGRAESGDAEGATPAQAVDLKVS